MYPARQAQWKRVPVLMHEVVTSQWFSPERGLQVPHVGGDAGDAAWGAGAGAGLGEARVRAVVVARRKVKVVEKYMLRFGVWMGW